MTERPAGTMGKAFAERSAPGRPGPRTEGASAGQSLATPAPDRWVYRDGARLCLERLVRMMGPAPWLDRQPHSTLAEGKSASALYRRQAATLAIALVAENDHRVDTDGYLRECVRTSLIRWQLSLRGDGRPAERRLRRCPLHGAVAGLTTQLLAETSGYQTELLLDDLASHMMWLARGRRRTPWLEATIICALADAAVVVRDLSLLNGARRRVKDLLDRQDPEGWFPERSGADVGRLSLTIDALARLYHQNGWEELLEPLTRACRLMLHFVHPDGLVGGCYSSCGTAFLSPYGVELLAPTIVEAASLALVARKRCARMLAEGIPSWHDDLLAIMGPRMALAAPVAPPDLYSDAVLPCRSKGHTHFPGAGLAIYSTDEYYAVVGGRNGGALYVTWRDGTPGLDEPGVTVVFPRATRCAGRRDRHAYTQVTPSSTTSQGILEIPTGVPRRGWRRLVSSILRLFRSSPTAREGMPPKSGQSPVPADRRPITHDRYRREIAFEDDTIRIRDAVQCRLPCQAIICQSPPTTEDLRFVDPESPAVSIRPPLFVEGGRKVEIQRVYRQGVLVENRVMRP